MTRFYISTLIVLLTLSISYGQTNEIVTNLTKAVQSPDHEEKDDRVKGDLKWDNKLSAGFSLSSGNSELLDLNAALSVNRNRMWINEYDFKAELDWRTDQGVQTFLKITAAFRYGHSFTKKIYGFMGIAADSDYAALVEYNLYPNLGFGYWFFDTGRIKLMNELGTGYNYYKYQDQTTSENFGLYYKLFLEWKIWPNVTWNESFTLRPAWSDFSDFVLNNKTEFKIKLKKNLDLVLTHLYDYDNIPASGALNYDTTFTTGLEWKF